MTWLVTGGAGHIGCHVIRTLPAAGNVKGLRKLVSQCDRAGVRSFLFSSSGAAYGASDSGAVSQDAPCRPVNPYGQSKLAGERLVHGVGAATGMRTMALRYFNVAGAAESGLGDVHGDNSIPTILRVRDVLGWSAEHTVADMSSFAWRAAEVSTS